MMRVIGCISGTSADGIDVACLDTNGLQVQVVGRGATYPYAPALRQRLLQAMRSPPDAQAAFALERDTTLAHCQAVQRYVREQQPGPVQLVGMHGQTILHQPEQRRTVQLLDGALAAATLQCDVVCQFRQQDMDAGGQGAPLVPLYHQARAQGLAQPLMVLNWGGVGNVSYLDGDVLLAFDSGPANALLDDWVRAHSDQDFDRDGELSRAGHVDESLLAAWLGHPYFSQPAPKSLDRNSFHGVLDSMRHLSLADGAATLAAFTVRATALAQTLCPKPVRRWLVAGGGRLNRTLMHELQQHLSCPVAAVESVGWQGDSLEAECFAFLAVRSRQNLPLSLPSTTGVAAPQCGGTWFCAAG